MHHYAAKQAEKLKRKWRKNKIKEKWYPATEAWSSGMGVGRGANNPTL
jgi:hypothetical protein